MRVIRCARTFRLDFQTRNWFVPETGAQVQVGLGLGQLLWRGLGDANKEVAICRLFHKLIVSAQ